MFWMVLYFFPVIRGARTIFDWNNDIGDVIIVGISTSNFSVDRHYDYTTSVDTAYDKEEDKSHDKPKGTYKSGGTAQFLESLKTEIIPFVDKNYKTNSDRGIAGSSLGGLFTAYRLVNSDGYFIRFGLGSPSLMLDNEKLLNQAFTQFKENKTWDLPQTRVYISVGDYEENPEQMPPMIKFSKYLEDSNYDTIKLKWQIFHDETHLSA
jgi:predicted alpha/beta superfamily hydrolase